MSKSKKEAPFLQMPKELKEQIEVFNRLTTELLLLALEAAGNNCECSVCKKVREISKDLKKYLELGLKMRGKVG